jgi:hypothetical protein
MKMVIRGLCVCCVLVAMSQLKSHGAGIELCRSDSGHDCIAIGCGTACATTPHDHTACAMTSHNCTARKMSRHEHGKAKWWSRGPVRRGLRALLRGGC